MTISHQEIPFSAILFNARQGQTDIINLRSSKATDSTRITLPNKHLFLKTKRSVAPETARPQLLVRSKGFRFGLNLRIHTGKQMNAENLTWQQQIQRAQSPGKRRERTRVIEASEVTRSIAWASLTFYLSLSQKGTTPPRSQ